MKRFFLVAFLSFFLIGCAAIQDMESSPNSQGVSISQEEFSISSTSSTLDIQRPQMVFSAGFAIYTNGTKRTFTDKKYHNQSPDVYIDTAEPQRIHVTKQGVTWKDFFQTLPMSLTSNCLVTGTKQTFCSNDTYKLRFLINEVEVPNALDLEIKPNDFLEVEYGS